MEISEKIDSLLKSELGDDQRIGLELLKAQDYNDMEELRYKYRWHLRTDVTLEYIKYDINLEYRYAVKCLNKQGKETTTGITFVGWK